MEELLLPSEEEELRSEHGGRSGMWEKVRSLLKEQQQQLKRSLQTFKQHGLLTLSVIAVVTGCSLGFVLRGTQLSTQVEPPPSKVEGVNAGFVVFSVGAPQN